MSTILDHHGQNQTTEEWRTSHCLLTPILLHYLLLFHMPRSMASCALVYIYCMYIARSYGSCLAAVVNGKYNPHRYQQEIANGYCRTNPTNWL